MTLHLVRGLPGSGKSTYAKSLGCFHLEADMFFIRRGIYQFDGRKIKMAHHWCQDMAQRAINAGVDVVVANTFTTMKELQPYISMAKFSGDHPLRVYKCTGGYGSIHMVPNESMERMKRRWVDYPGEIEV